MIDGFLQRTNLTADVNNKMHFNSPPLSLGVYIFEMEKLVISAFLYNKIPILSLSFSPSLLPFLSLLSLSLLKTFLEVKSYSKPNM